MLKHLTFAIAGLVFAAVPASAENGYAFTVENDLGAAITIYADGTSKCDLAPGASCRVTVSNPDAAFAYAGTEGARVSFAPGNLEMVDLCKLDTKGAHCTDPTHLATN